MQKERTRVYALARELDMESKDLLDMCRQAGYDVKNQLSSLDPDQRDAIELMIKRGGKTAVAVAPPPPAAAPPQPLPNLEKKVPVLNARRAPEVPARPAAPAAVTPAPTAPVAAPKEAAPPPPAAPKPAVVAPAAQVAPLPPQTEMKPHAPAASAPPPPAATPRPPEAPKPPAAPTVAPAAAKAPEPPKPTAPVPPSPPPRPPDAAPPRVDSAPRVPVLTPNRVQNLNSPRPGGDGNRNRPPRVVRPGPGAVSRSGPPNLAPPPTPKKPIITQQPIKAQTPIQRPIAPLTPELLKQNLTPQQRIDKAREALRTQTPVAPPPDVAVDDDGEGDGEGKGKKGGGGGAGKKAPGVVPGRNERHKSRNERAKDRKVETVVKALTGTLVGPVEVPEDDRPKSRKPRSIREAAKQKKPGTAPRSGNKVPIDLPITVRSLSQVIGMQAVPLLFSLNKYGIANATINSFIEPMVAETIALDKGIELEIKKSPDVESRVIADADKPSDPEHLILRAPVVAVMGHVDHGKTSLLDKIRQSDKKIVDSDIVSTEAGGITQVIRAWRVEHGGKPVTFLDTPGHEAFTKMRARGAQVTDIAVIVVAADDGVMPQTEEAISHAKAAGVSIVVVINKIDLPNANLKKTEQQLYSLNLLPDTMGGDTPFVYTSAAKGQGIDELLDMLSLVAELKELKADPTRPAKGTCLEAALSEGEGVRATLLVRDGTLRRGDVLLCGSTYGRVRAMYDDLGRPIQEAGPSVPVRVTGLDEVPDADDPFVVVEDLAVAREVAEMRKGKRHGSSLQPQRALTLESFSLAKVAELKVILKADFKGSVEAIKKELEKLHHAEVRVNVLHTGIGAINESDVGLALTSPQDTIIVGFNVVPDDRAKALAEERGIQIREYQIIYNLTNDIRSAMEGKLKPHEQVVHLGRAIVRQTFKISRVGTIAGCYVTQGVIERSAKIRLIRQGEIIFPPPERTASLESLKRIKEDAREVREGFECGMKIAGYDDVKVDDVIECFRIEQVQRKL